MSVSNFKHDSEPKEIERVQLQNRNQIQHHAYTIWFSWLTWTETKHLLKSIATRPWCWDSCCGAYDCAGTFGASKRWGNWGLRGENHQVAGMQAWNLKPKSKTHKDTLKKYTAYVNILLCTVYKRSIFIHSYLSQHPNCWIMMILLHTFTCKVERFTYSKHCITLTFWTNMYYSIRGVPKLIFNWHSCMQDEQNLLSSTIPWLLERCWLGRNTCLAVGVGIATSWEQHILTKGTERPKDWVRTSCCGRISARIFGDNQQHHNLHQITAI